MRKILLTLMAALLVACSFGVAQAGNIEDLMLDCDFVRLGVATVALDTLWFTTLQSGAGTGLDFDGGTAEEATWFPVATIPYGVQGDGTLVNRRSRVKKVLLYSAEPFQYHVDYAGGFSTLIAAGSAQYYAVADTVDIAAGPGTEMSKYPCRAMITFPDSMILKEGGSDTVRFLLGY